MDLLSAYASISVKNIDQAKEFYQDKLGLEILLDGSPNIILLGVADSRFMVYQKDNHQPATHTSVNLAVENVEDAVNQLAAKGVEFEEDEAANDKGIVEQGPMKIAWFKDPDGNTLALTEGL